MVALGFILGLAGIILLIAGAGQAAQNRAFRGAQTVTGTVIYKHSRKLKNGRAYLLKLSYSADGTVYEREVGVSAAEYEAIGIGGGYEVQYRPDKPKKILRPKDTNPKTVKVFLILGAVLLAAGAALLFIGRMTGIK